MLTITFVLLNLTRRLPEAVYDASMIYVQYICLLACINSRTYQNYTRAFQASHSLIFTRKHTLISCNINVSTAGSSLARRITINDESTALQLLSDGSEVIGSISSLAEDLTVFIITIIIPIIISIVIIIIIIIYNIIVQKYKQIIDKK
jgi:ABC-type antimicrobial peptide transport system permease subunit